MISLVEQKTQESEKSQQQHQDQIQPEDKQESEQSSKQAVKQNGDNQEHRASDQASHNHNHNHNHHHHQKPAGPHAVGCDSPLLNLPTEIIFEIIKRLEFMDIVLLRETCKQMECIVDKYKEICKESYEQQQMYSRAIAAHGEDYDEIEDEENDDDVGSSYYDDDARSVYDYIGGYDEHDFNEYRGYYYGQDTDDEFFPDYY